MLSSAEYQRYARQIALPNVGVEGQERLKRARVLVVGAGGLGSPVAMYLCAAGIGTLGIVDFDRVDVSNLHRQLLHGTADIGRPKVESAAARLGDINPLVRINAIETAFSRENARGLVSEYDLVVDASDNFPSRYLVNDACVLEHVPYVYGSVERFEGQVAIFATSDGPCYRCLFREPPPPGLVPTCAEAGVFGVIPGLIGTLQANEAIKWILGVGESLAGRLLIVDAARIRLRTIAVARDPRCPVCGTAEQTELIDYDAFCGLKPNGRQTTRVPEIEARALAQRLASGAAVLLVDVREPWEYDIARLPNARLMPGSELSEGDIDLPTDQDIVVYCHHGSRSEYWVAKLMERGYERVAHLRGGTDAWSTEVDPSVPRY
jgi:molybdopterin/thiamine biosynthesis adenylyltransferase/rhodanese-related sulfurtransferase